MTEMTMKRAAQTALDVQNASNLSGVVHSFAKIVSLLHARPDCTGTAWVATHPVSVLFAAQVAMLTGVAPLANQEVYSNAYQACQELAAAETPRVDPVEYMILNDDGTWRTEVARPLLYGDVDLMTEQEREDALLAWGRDNLTLLDHESIALVYTTPIDEDDPRLKALHENF